MMLGDSLPDLAVLLHRNGTILARLGGRLLTGSPLSAAERAAACDSLLSDVHSTLQQLARKAIASREVIESELRVSSRSYEAHVSPIGPERVVCIVRACPEVGRSHPATSAEVDVHLDRRGFLRRLRHSMSAATLHERPIAIAVLLIEGIAEIARTLDAALAEQVIAVVMQRLGTLNTAGPEPDWYLGQLTDGLFVVVLQTADKTVIERRLEGIAAAFRHSVQLGDSEFVLTPYAGAAILGQDATTPKTLLQHARTAAAEARRAATRRVQFFSDTLQLRTLARLDAAQELRDAIESKQLGLRYAERRDLQTGTLTALVSYVRWTDPIRGTIAPGEFLRIAEATGSAKALSRSLLELLQVDFAGRLRTLDPSVRISYGPLRHHLLADDFIADMQSFLRDSAIPAERLELRISERTYVAREVAFWNELAEAGIQLVVDEFGREVSSFELLARGPVWGVQLDRSWACSCALDPVARKVCRAVIKLTAGLGLTPLAAGIDNEATRALLKRFGCQQGHGDLYEPGPAQLPMQSALKLSR